MLANLLCSASELTERTNIQPAVQDFRYHDPRQLEGTPYEVAGAAFDQALSVGRLYQKALDDAFILARNAEMERELHAGKPPNGAGFPYTALGERIGIAKTEFGRVQKTVKGAAAAACYDPSLELEDEEVVV